MLTEHQNMIMKEAVTILKSKDILLIKGSAGTGKTFLINTLIGVLKPKGKVYCTAPTNKAVSVMEAKIRENVTFGTIHSILKLKRNISNEGVITFKPHGVFTALPGSLIICDEASMLNTEILSLLLKSQKQNYFKLIFLGDEKQLNPVSEEESPVFHSNFPSVTLTEIVRQALDNPIIRLSMDLSQIYKYQPCRNDIGGYVYSNDEEKVIETLSISNGSSYLKYLAYTNAEVDRMNFLVRSNIYGSEASKLEVGETMIFSAPHGEYYTNQEILIEDLQVMTGTFPVPCDVTELFLLPEPSFTYYCVNGAFNVIHEESEKAFNSLLEKLKFRIYDKKLSWQEWFEYKETFAVLAYNHAITVHKSQGSTYTQTIINLKDLNKCRSKKEKQRLLYTAVTRASQLNIFYNV